MDEFLGLWIDPTDLRTCAFGMLTNSDCDSTHNNFLLTLRNLTFVLWPFSGTDQSPLGSDSLLFCAPERSTADACPTTVDRSSRRACPAERRGAAGHGPLRGRHDNESGGPLADRHPDHCLRYASYRFSQRDAKTATSFMARLHGDFANEVFAGCFRSLHPNVGTSH